MYRILYSLIDLLAALVFILPLFFIFEKCLFHNIKRTVIYAIFSCYIACMLSIVGFPNIIEFEVDLSGNVIPIIGMLEDIPNSILNILLFIPFGIFVSFLWKKFRNSKAIIILSLCVSSFIEIMQIFTFRSTDIDDLITNTLGGYIGYLFIKFITKNFNRFMIFSNDNEKTNIKDLYVIFICIVLVMLILQPLVSSFIWDIIYR